MTLSTPANDLRTVRALIGATNLPRQLNVAGAGPLGTAAYETMTQLLAAHHAGGYSGRDRLLEMYAEARAQVAELMGTIPSLLSFQPSVSSIVTTLSRSITLEPGDQVLTWDVEHGSTIRAWHVRALETGAELVRVQPPLDEPWDTRLLLEQVDERTKVLTVSSIQSFDGSATDLYALREACDAVGALLLVDLSQHLGIADVTPAVALADAAYACAHKWLLGPVGVAVATFTPDLVSSLTPPAYGASSIDIAAAAQAAVWFDPSVPLRSDVGLLEAGTPPLLGAVSTGAAARAMSAVGVERVQRAALGVRAEIVSLLDSHDLHPVATVVDPVSPIIALRPGPEELPAIVDGLRQEHFHVILRGDVLRLSPWAMEWSEVDQLLTGLDRALTR
ncbi:aminotransferase class V-fold PLP-dependent enzyme [Nocardioides jishulii]|uniref:Aminotransferase class V-fold PLP-dependent enzyme n=1 Tax=Nocardioides jishulii TaxID=2575440 RepID=A0A4V5TKK1_9ACTN|nr:aminotransferase class V-fold PLP-dependent enzyme [Nocardioides jishulii]QCX26196.1 aminotransferase class V-fold PLP-dependent enzyme [Nocardioides jishulii]TKI64003.1 aminotransferase class V-fold PLP-dependent enzyme [Nocardioides jishulii]